MAALRTDREQARSHKVLGDPVGASLLANFWISPDFKGLQGFIELLL
jgi:hypothetical protein